MSISMTHKSREGRNFSGEGWGAVQTETLVPGIISDKNSSFFFPLKEYFICIVYLTLATSGANLTRDVVIYTQTFFLHRI